INPRDMNTVTVGWAMSPTASSLTAAPSASNDHETPAELMPFQAFVLTVAWRQIERNGFPDPCAVRMIEGAVKAGKPDPSAVVVPSGETRYSFHAATARISSGERNGWGSETSFI